MTRSTTLLKVTLLPQSLRILLLLLFTFSLNTVNAIPMESPTLTLTVENIKKSKGFLMIAVRNAKGEDVKLEKVAVSSTPRQTVSIDLPANGDYTIAMFHDVNGNGELDKGVFGQPTEPYGFSNNARETFSEPSLEDQKFTVNGNTSHSIKIK